jgi:hypothetical protein
MRAFFHTGTETLPIAAGGIVQEKHRYPGIVGRIFITFIPGMQKINDSTLAITLFEVSGNIQ